MTLSSNVTTRRLPRAWSRISCRSSGLANRALMTPIDQPSASSASAASMRAGHDRPEADEQEVAALAQDLAPADRQDLRLDRRQPEAGVTRVVQRERAFLREGGPNERAQLLLVLRARR